MCNLIDVVPQPCSAPPEDDDAVMIYMAVGCAVAGFIVVVSLVVGCPGNDNNKVFDPATAFTNPMYDDPNHGAP